MFANVEFTPNLFPHEERANTKQSNALHVIILLIAEVTIMRSQLGII